MTDVFRAQIQLFDFESREAEKFKTTKTIVSAQ